MVIMSHDIMSHVTVVGQSWDSHGMIHMSYQDDILLVPSDPLHPPYVHLQNDIYVIKALPMLPIVSRHIFTVNIVTRTANKVRWGQVDF